MYDSLHREALKGNVQAAKEYLDRMESKVTDTLQPQVGPTDSEKKELDLPDYLLEMISPLSTETK